MCAQPLVDGKCVGEKYVPNYKDKYFVEFNSGVGSYSGAVTINNGWMLGGATSTGSATPFVTDLLDAAMTDNSGKPSGCTEGVYVLNSDNQFVEFDGSPFRSSAE